METTSFKQSKGVSVSVKVDFSFVGGSCQAVLRCFSIHLISVYRVKKLSIAALTISIFLTAELLKKSELESESLSF